MKKKYEYVSWFALTRKQKMLFMKIQVIIMLFISLQVSASVLSQRTVSLNLTNSTLKECIVAIEKQTDLGFLYNGKELNDVKGITVKVNNKRAEEVLEEILIPHGFKFIIENNVILIKKEAQIQQQQYPEIIAVQGVVTDTDGIPLPGVNVTVKGMQIKGIQGVITDQEGKFYIYTYENNSLIFSFIGMGTKEVPINGQLEINVVLQDLIEVLKDVVVTGYFTRNKETYTGSATIVEGQELHTLNPSNVTEALSVLDPSFVIEDNNLIGSDPNNLPSIRIQGESSFAGQYAINRNNINNVFVGDPNLPLFILDGFEVTYQYVTDMDVTRIDQISILKDAAATSVYGSRASNGVIVITTKVPEQGRIDLTYNAYAKFSFPDLSTYDYLNAKEKFQLDKDLGLYSTEEEPWLYNAIARYVGQGIDTDWLAQPTRNGISQNHSINLRGGEEKMRYDLNLNYDNEAGVMKDSKRENYSITANLHYNLSTRIGFRNSITYSRNNAKNSPYGSFSTYTQMNPYFPVYNQAGNLIKYYYTDPELDGAYRPIGEGITYNPVYEARVGSFDKANYSSFLDNMSFFYTFDSGIKLELSGSIGENTNGTETFLSPDSGTYTDIDKLETRGKYSTSSTRVFDYSGLFAVGYNKALGDRHIVNANLGAEIRGAKGTIDGYTVEGFQDPLLNKPNRALRYQENSVPAYAETETRQLGGYLSANYSYDQRYLVDVSYRLDGSSQFGSNKRYAPFYSVGIGWNLHKESFMNERVFSMLKLRATYGVTGSVKFAAYQALDTYSINTNVRYLSRPGFYLKAIGNEDLKWQSTTSYNVGVDFGLFNNWVSGTFNYYYKKTKDVILPINIAPSIGFENINSNLGRQENKGYEIFLRSTILKRKDLKVNIFINGSHDDSKLLEISNALQSINDQLNGSTDHTQFVQYREGESLTAIYAVRSLGIDPATGKEIFIKRDGTTTFTWDAKDKVIVGDASPDLLGNTGFNIRYKNFTLQGAFSYRIGGQAYNQTLVNRVENANVYNNVDRRVLTQSWFKPGDIAKYGDPINGESANPSSRFVQDYNYLKFTSLSLRYDLSGENDIVKMLGMKNLMFQLTTNDLLYVSSVKLERGTDYPFARSVTFSLRTNF